MATLLMTAGILAADKPQTDAWHILVQAVDARGPDEASALGMLGAIGNPESRALIEATLKGKDIAAIGLVAVGLTPDQCALYLPDLARAARDPGGGPKLIILDAIARAGTSDAARILADIADSAGLPTAGVAFGLLEQRMASVAEPLLIETVTSGRSTWSRETAAWTLIRMRAAGALAAFRSALHDTDDRVRFAAAVGLAHLRDAEGKPQLEAAARDHGGKNRIEALVSLAVLGQPEALDSLNALATSPDEAVRGRVVWAMAGSGSMNLKQFAYRLGLDRQAVPRRMLAEKLFDPGDPRDMALLQEMLANGDDISQLVAAQRLLGTKITDRAENVVARALGSEREAARTLALKIASARPALQPELARRLSSPDPAVQIAALSAIAGLHQKERFVEVTPYLASEARAVSAAAARTLVALDPNAAKPGLEEGLASTSSHVRIHSAAMLLAAGVRAQPQ